jgi:hypothetical protein
MDNAVVDDKVLCFSTGQYRWFVRLSDQVGLEPSVVVSPLFFLPQWCLGMSVVQGHVMGVVDLESLLGQVPPISVPEKAPLLVLKAPHKISVRLTDLFGLQNLSQFKQTSDYPLVHQVFGGAFLNPQQDVFYELNVSALNVLVEKESKQIGLDESRFSHA